MIKESQILWQQGKVWVLDAKTSYDVMVDGITHAISDSSYHHNSDGLSIAIARAKYLSRKGK